MNKILLYTVLSDIGLSILFNNIFNNIIPVSISSIKIGDFVVIKGCYQNDKSLYYWYKGYVKNINNIKMKITIVSHYDTFDNIWNLLPSNYYERIFDRFDKSYTIYKLI